MNDKRSWLFAKLIIGFLALGVVLESIEHVPLLPEAEKRDMLYNNSARFFQLKNKEMKRHRRGEYLALAHIRFAPNPVAYIRSIKRLSKNAW